jgi:hypothetical protein
MFDMKEAEALARRQVKALCPELEHVAPCVQLRKRYIPPAKQLAALNVYNVASDHSSEAEEYVFTFANKVPTTDGHTLSQVARVTVNMRQGVVKTTTSR